VDAHHLFVIRHPERDRIREHLRAAGVETMIHYAHPLHQQPAYHTAQTLPETERWAAQVMSLPLNSTLTDEQQEYVISRLLAVI
jgi:dTDP-4-amino-4,6-dideoxygalactose transaminase